MAKEKFRVVRVSFFGKKDDFSSFFCRLFSFTGLKYESTIFPLYAPLWLAHFKPPSSHKAFPTRYLPHYEFPTNGWLFTFFSCSPYVIITMFGHLCVEESEWVKQKKKVENSPRARLRLTWAVIYFSSYPCSLRIYHFEIMDTTI